MGGVKESGLGRLVWVSEGLLRFVKTQSIVIHNLLLQRPTLARVDGLCTKGLYLALN